MSLSSLFGGPPKPQRPAAPPTPDNSAAEIAAALELERKARGRASTILTGPGGLTSSPTTAANILLGAT